MTAFLKRTYATQWRTRLGVIAAALASVAPSQPSWQVDAAVREERVPQGKAIRYVIGASQKPYSVVEDDRAAEHWFSDVEAPAEPQEPTDVLAPPFVLGAPALAKLEAIQRRRCTKLRVQWHDVTEGD